MNTLLEVDQINPKHWQFDINLFLFY